MFLSAPEKCVFVQDAKEGGSQNGSVGSSFGFTEDTSKPNHAFKKKNAEEGSNGSKWINQMTGGGGRAWGDGGGRQTDRYRV